MADNSRDAEPKEARRSKRARTFLHARLSYGDGAISTECTVNQLSDFGGRINVASSVALPDMFEVAIPQKGICRRAKLVWRKDDQAGIDFLDDRESLAVPDGEDPLMRIKALEAENSKLKGQIGALLQQVHRLTED